MKIENVILGENDDFLRGREACDRSGEKQKTIMLIVPDKFRDDVESLSSYIGENKFESGLTIEVTLNELLSVVPRKRRRTDAYDALVKYLRDERDITLTIKTKKR